MLNDGGFLHKVCNFEIVSKKIEKSLLYSSSIIIIIEYHYYYYDKNFVIDVQLINPVTANNQQNIMKIGLLVDDFDAYVNDGTFRL